jgi:hypothetical protein
MQIRLERSMARQTLTDRKVQSLKAAPKGKRSQTMDRLVPGRGVHVATRSGRNGGIDPPESSHRIGADRRDH